MPYIKSGQRDVIGPLDYRQVPITSVGELNFAISKLCHEYIKQTAFRYTTLNEVIGVLECAKQELYRMVVAPYENKKQAENGSISELDYE
jgi:hypothetical protein